MNHKLSSLICASFALVCFVCNEASLQAQVYMGSNTGGCSTCGVGPHFTDIYTSHIYGGACGCGGRGWYQRNFGAEYCFNYAPLRGVGCCNYTNVIGGCGARPVMVNRPTCYTCNPALATMYTPACCGAVPNCCGAMSSGPVMTQPSTAVPTPTTPAPAVSNDPAKAPTPAATNPAPAATSAPAPEAPKPGA